MRAMRFASGVGTAAVLFALFATASGAQERANSRPPVINVYSRNGAMASNYVTPAIEVSEDAYVFAVAMDLDGQIQVLHPDFPGISVKLRARKTVELPNFFAGFRQYDNAYSGYSNAGYNGYSGYSGSDYDDVRGTVIGIASRAPFNLERIERGGDWDMSLIRSLIERRSPSGAAQALANYLGVRGEPIGRDWLRFAGGRRDYYSYADNAYSSCDLYYGYAYGGPTLAFSRIQAINRILALRRAGQQVRIVGYDFCGMPLVTYGPSASTGLPIFRRPQRPAGDTTVFPKTRYPHGVARTPPESNGSSTAAFGAFPQSRQSDPRMGDVTITAPPSSRANPQEILERLRAENGGAGVPRGRMPIEASEPSSTPRAAARPNVTGYRPEPTMDPQPVRAPDRTRESPPPPPPASHSPPPARTQPSSPPPHSDTPPPARRQ